MLITHCDSCAQETEHDVLRESSADILVRCTECQTVQTLAAPTVRTLLLKTIVSSEGVSMVCGVEAPQGEVIRVGSVVVAECGEDAYGVEITSIEYQDRRFQFASADHIDTLWTRVVDRVVVKASIHEGRNTIPVYTECEGGDAFTVGETYEFGNRRFRVSHIKLRDGGLLRWSGQGAPAQHIKRIYGYRL
ncbi:MAG: hypothetical protein LUQ13_02955 [Methanomicrobiales archaeon]|nr:hypothetical protein [Methanomicrobiales archaeon]